MSVSTPMAFYLWNRRSTLDSRGRQVSRQFAAAHIPLQRRSDYHNNLWTLNVKLRLVKDMALWLEFVCSSRLQNSNGSRVPVTWEAYVSSGEWEVGSCFRATAFTSFLFPDHPVSRQASHESPRNSWGHSKVSARIHATRETVPKMSITCPRVIFGRPKPWEKSGSRSILWLTIADHQGWWLAVAPCECYHLCAALFRENHQPVKRGELNKVSFRAEGSLADVTFVANLWLGTAVMARAFRNGVAIGLAGLFF